MHQKKITGYTIFMQEIIGKGSYGTVYKCEKDSNKQICAVKMLKKENINADEYLKRALFDEISILQSVNSEYIVGVYDVMESASNYYIVQEYCAGGDLAHFIKEHKNISEERATKIIKEICCGFLTLVKEGIVHRDLKPANILLCAKGTAKIADFGFAKKMRRKGKMIETSVGTPLYMSMEVMCNEPYTSKCDVWAVGLIFYELLHGCTPWKATRELELVEKTKNIPLQFTKILQPITKEFITHCLSIKEKERFGWDQVFMHPIFEHYFDEYKEKNEVFENKLKMVLRELRLTVNSDNIDLNRLLERLGLKELKELNYENFTKFIKVINVNITQEEIEFFFRQMDTNEDGTVDMNELTTCMSKHGIVFNKNLDAQESKPLINSKEYSNESEQLSNELKTIAKQSFKKLYKILTSKNINLYNTFTAYDRDKSGELSVKEFTIFMKRLNNGISEEEIINIFDFLDLDHSGTIEFDEFNSFYCKVNGLPEVFEKYLSENQSNLHR